ncbi:hypothetical protein VF21_05197 [Pseudogymnoascus sp. 05NY08]|nr:hypothetical protein VF21_05197 [Pseudogymnoascus sp. 05NY08]
MKLPLALSVAFGAIIARAATVPSSLLGERCTPGKYYCNQSPVFECGTYYAAIVICDDTGYDYTPIACCDEKRGCRVINGEPHCM